MMDHLNQMDPRRAPSRWTSCTWTPPTRTGAAAAAITAADIAAGGTVMDRRTSLMRKSEK